MFVARDRPVGIITRGGGGSKYIATVLFHQHIPCCGVCVRARVVCCPFGASTPDRFFLNEKFKPQNAQTHKHSTTAPEEKGTRRKRKIWRASTGSCCLCVRACARARDILRLALPTSISRRDDDGVHGWLTLREAAAAAAQRAGKKLH